MTQTTDLMDAASAAAAAASPEDVPAEVAHRQLDSALAAELAVSPTPTAPRREGPLPGILLLLVCLALLAGLRPLARTGRTRWRVRPAPSCQDAGRASGAGDAAGGVPRGLQVASSPEAIPLPPHVAALIRRVDARRCREAAATNSAQAQASGPRVSRPGTSGLDVWVGRERP